MTLSVQLYTLLSMIGTGLGMAWIYDIYSWARKKLHLRFFFTFLFDIAYWLFFAWVILFVLLYVNEGKLRVTLFFALLTGGLCYFNFFSRPVMAVWDELIRIIVSIFRFIARMIQIVLITPCKWLIGGIITLIVGISAGLWKGITTLFRWFRKPFDLFFHWLKQLALALLHKVGKMITRMIARIFKRKPRDE